MVGSQTHLAMKKQLFLGALVAVALNLLPASAQPGPRGPRFDASMSKLFGENTAFSAALDFQTKDKTTGDTMGMPGKLAYLEGKVRFEMDMTQMRSASIPPEAAEGMKAMGMGNIIIISRPDKKLAYMIYPGLKAYTENETKDIEDLKTSDKFKLEATELGKETVAGHPCVKNKVVVTDDKGVKHESTVWNATDLKQFPVKIEANENDTPMTMLFKDIKLAKPDAAQFEPPKDLKRYDNMQALMQEEMMKRMGGAGGLPQR